MQEVKRKEWNVTCSYIVYGRVFLKKICCVSLQVAEMVPNISYDSIFFLRSIDVSRQYLFDYFTTDE